MKRTLLLTLALLLVLTGPALAQEEEAPDPTKRFWEARKIMLKGDPLSAAELFRVLASEHSGSGIADDSIYWMGRCYLRVDDREVHAGRHVRERVLERDRSLADGVFLDPVRDVDDLRVRAIPRICAPFSLAARTGCRPR